MENKKKTITIKNFPEELWWQAKELAAKRRMLVQDFLIDLVKWAVNKDKKEEE